MSLFDAYIMVDWSASSSPCQGKDSVWIAQWHRGAQAPVPINPPTRQLAFEALVDLLRGEVRAGSRVLVGCDFPYGYPAGFAEAVGLAGPAAPWKQVWHMLQEDVSDEANNRNNRFQAAANVNARLGSPPGPFWGSPDATPGVPQKKPVFPYATAGLAKLAEYRHTEVNLRDRKEWVHSVWQLWTAGSVGGQALTGIPRVATLRDHQDLALHSRAWPFESGFTSEPTRATGPAIVHAEIWPGVVPTDLSLHQIKDAAQVLSLVQHFGSLDDRGQLGPLFRQPQSMGADALRDCLTAEGWILGV